MRRIIFVSALLLALPSLSPAAFGVLLPTDDIVSQSESPMLDLQLRLFDPAARRYVPLAKPQRFGVQQLGDQADLLTALKPGHEAGPALWHGAFAVKRPGDIIFFAEYAPHWEAADDQFVIHLAKLCISALGLEEGWDEPVGLDAEIVPLSRPYGLWTGNLFSGQVLLDGEPAPYAAVEVVWLGSTPDAPPAIAAPAPAYLVQKIRADAGGVFHCAMPRSGWWGFAAQLDTDRAIRKDDEEKPVVMVTSLWVLARDMK